MTTGIEREPTWYDFQLEDEARIGDAAAENKWHPRKRNPDAAALKHLNASFDECVRQCRNVTERRIVEAAE